MAAWLAGALFAVGIVAGLGASFGAAALMLVVGIDVIGANVAIGVTGAGFGFVGIGVVGAWFGCIGGWLLAGVAGVDIAAAAGGAGMLARSSAVVFALISVVSLGAIAALVFASVFASVIASVFALGGFGNGIGTISPFGPTRGMFELNGQPFYPLWSLIILSMSSLVLLK